MRRVASVVLLLVGVVIGLGAFGPSFMGRLVVDGELDKFPIAGDVYSMLYVVWYFVGGCMLLFALIIALAWFGQRSGEASLLLVTALIGGLYLCAGVGGMVYRHGDLFMPAFILEGALLLVCSLVLGRAREVAAPGT